MIITDIIEDDLSVTNYIATINGFPNCTIPVEPGNGFYDKIVIDSLPITSFFDVTGRLDEAKLIATNEIGAFSKQSTESINVSVAGFSFDVTPLTLGAVVANQLVSTANLELEDDGSTVRTLNDAEQKALINSYTSARAKVITDRSSEQAAIQAVTEATTTAAAVAEIDALLAASAFGTLGPVYT